MLIDIGDRREILTEVLGAQFDLEIRSSPHKKTFIGPQGCSVTDLFFSDVQPIHEIQVAESIDRRHAKIISHWDLSKILDGIIERPKKIKEAEH